MKFLYLTLLCALVSAAPIVEEKRTISGAGVDGLNKALKAATDSIRNLGLSSGLGGLGSGLGASKRDEKQEARQAEQVDKRDEGPSKITAILQTASHAVLGPNGIGGGVGLKRREAQEQTQEPNKRGLNIPNNVLDDVTSGKLMEDLHNLHITG